MTVSLIKATPNLTRFPRISFAQSGSGRRRILSWCEATHHLAIAYGNRMDPVNQFLTELRANYPESKSFNFNERTYVLRLQP